MNKVLVRWNQIVSEAAAHEIMACCGSMSWAREMAAQRPFDDEGTLVAASGEIWNGLTAQDWMEAFSTHPRIGERKAPAAAGERAAAWSALEQQGVDFWWLDWQQGEDWGVGSIPHFNPTFWLNYVFFTNPTHWARTGRRNSLLHRWGGLGNHRYQIGFSGDTISVWESLARSPAFFRAIPVWRGDGRSGLQSGWVPLR